MRLLPSAGRANSGVSREVSGRGSEKSEVGCGKLPLGDSSAVKNRKHPLAGAWER